MEVSEAAIQKVMEDPFNEQSVVTVVWGEDWLKGVIGIVASRLIEKFYKPTIVFTESHGVYAGSARSIEGIDIYQALNDCRDYLLQFGGHTMAAGMSVERERVKEFREKFDQVVRSKMEEIPAIPTFYYDMELLLEQIDLDWVREMQGLAPFGPENMTPVFLFKNVHHVYPPKIIGNDGKHVKCTFRQQSVGKYWDAVGFSMAKDWDVICQKSLDVLASLEINEYNGRVSVQLMLKAVRVHQE
jgi:single-stranded-DNA-specific exonuclease